MVDQDGNVAVTVTTIGGGSLPMFHVQRDGAVSRIKDKLEEQYGYPQDARQLVLQGAILQDGCLPDVTPGQLVLALALLPFDKAEALLCATMEGHEAAVRNLLCRVAHDDEERSALLRDDDFGMTALQVAAFYGHTSVCEALFEAAQSTEERGGMLAAKVACSDSHAKTALHFAVFGGHEEVSRVLLAAATSAEVCECMLLTTNHLDQTALHLSVLQGHRRICQALVEAAPSQEVRNGMLTATDHEGKTAAHPASHDCRLLLEST